MLLEVCRIWADWFGDATNGVNARLAGVERDAGDAVPADLATIAEPTTHQGLARLELPVGFTFPGLLVLPYQDALFEDGIATQLFRAEDYPMAFVYVDDNADSAAGWRDGSYVLRAVLRAVNALMDPVNVASRTRNSVVIEAMDRITAPRPTAGVENAAVSLAVLASFQVTEQNP